MSSIGIARICRLSFTSPAIAAHRITGNVEFASDVASPSLHASRQVFCMAQRSGLWRSRNMGREAVEVAQELQWAEMDESRVEDILRVEASRLVKEDIMAVLSELQRQDKWNLSLKVFNLIRKDVWYKPDHSMYKNMINCLGKGHQQEIALQLFKQLEDEGLSHNEDTYTAMISCFCVDNMVHEAIDLLRAMERNGVDPVQLAYTTIIKACESIGAGETAEDLRKESIHIFGAEDRVSMQEIMRITRRVG